jgi:hypothetical protein
MNQLYLNKLNAHNALQRYIKVEKFNTLKINDENKLFLK